MKSIYFFLILIIFLQSCSLLNINQCRKYSSDSSTFRANSEATSTNAQFAEEKALLMAKKYIAEEVDNYILEKYDHKTFLADSEYETKITIARKTILSNINIICSKSVKKGDTYKSHMAIEISKSDIDKEVTAILKNNIY